MGANELLQLEVFFRLSWSLFLLYFPGELRAAWPIWGGATWIKHCRMRSRRLHTMWETAIAFDAFWHTRWPVWNPPNTDCWWGLAALCLPGVSLLTHCGPCSYKHEGTCGIPESYGQMFKNKCIFVKAANAFLLIPRPFFSLILEKSSDNLCYPDVLKFNSFHYP